MTREELAADLRSAELLAYSYDFDINAARSSELRFSVEQARIAPIAADAAGGMFAECQLPLGKTVLVYASSEFQGGTVATDLEDWLEILVALPYWFDLLKFSSGGSLTEMRRVEPLLIKETGEDTPEVWEAQRELRERLHLATPPDPVAKLHSNVTNGRDTILRAGNGAVLDSLFNRFRLEENPAWRHRAG